MTDADFVYAVRRAERDAGIHMVAQTLSVNVRTIGRWAVGKDLPSESVRERMVSHLLSQILALGPREGAVE